MKFIRILKIFSFFLLLMTPCLGESLTLDLGGAGGAGSMTGRMVQLFILFTILSLAPSIVITVTSFTRLVVVFSLLRNALGIQQSPPSMVLISLSIFLTTFIMEPVWDKLYETSISPLMESKINEKQALERGSGPVKEFMLANVREKDLKLFMDMAKVKAVKKPQDTPLRALVPAFLISELKKAFEIGFLLFIPFLVIDMVVASVLMSLGMMMLPPVMISLPFNLIFFVLVDGWYLLCGSLVQSFHH